MMAEDEDGTLSALRAHINVLEPVVLNGGGRVVKTTGDGMLMEFPSAVAALNAAVEIQSLMRVRNVEIPESRRMQFRLGHNLGDIVVDNSGDVFGDGANIAARVESVADPGGVSVTDAVYQAVTGKVAVAFVDDGDHELKNIEKPVRIWKVGSTSPSPQLLVAPGIRTLAIVAVLPFDNLSGGADQEYFADGITEDLLTALSHNRDLAVVARNSTFAYKGKAVDIRIIARALDATHVVEGSVRRSGNRVRVTAQLIDAESGHHIWAERYDRDLADIFELQDELVEAIAARLSPTFWEMAGRSRSEKDGRSFDAWDLTVQGQALVHGFDVESLVKAIDLFDRARRLEPGFVAPVARSAGAWFMLAILGWRSVDVNPWKRAERDAAAAFRLDKDDYWTLFALAVLKSVSGDPAGGVRHAQRMIQINPYAMFGFHMLGNNLDKAGEHTEGIKALTQAWRLGRHEPLRFDVANDLAHCHFMIGDYEPATAWGQQSLHVVDYLQTHIVMAAAYSQMNRADDAQIHVDAVHEARPQFSCEGHRSRLSYVRDEDRDLLIDGLLKAGLPE
ncbi:MAG: tetratricopeptide repeat protein [Acidimicrobiia bacterium]|nr:MAG: tetratricopeptide repeat protein [Acidimicrobiia bacterium]